MDLKGKTIIGFEIKRPLGVGGMAEVWYAENEIGKPAAVKMLNKELSGNAQIVDRFRSEAQIMVKLNHPNIRQVYGFGSVDERPAMVMEYLDGDDMKALIKNGRKFTEAEFERWWNQMVDALNYTHKQGIVHRDIKPANIFIDNDGNVKLLDFGIAKIRDSITSTQTGQKLGTLMYMSPEQVRSTKHTDYRTDIYSLAVTFVHLLSGKTPYDSDTSSDFEISECIVYKPLDMTGVPDSWRRFLGPYLEKQPESRPELRPFDSGNADAPANNDNTIKSEPAAPKKKEEAVGDVDGDETVFENAPVSAKNDTAKKEVKPVAKKEKPVAKADTKTTVKTESSTPTPAPVATEPTSAPANRKKTWIYVLIAAVVLLGGAIVWNVIVHQEKEAGRDQADVEKVNRFISIYNEKLEKCDFYIGNIVEDMDGNKGAKHFVIEGLETLKEIEGMESGETFGKTNLPRVFPEKLSQYRVNLQKSMNNLMKECHECEEAGLGNNIYTQELRERIDLMNRILDQSKDGSAKNVDIRPPKQ